MLLIFLLSALASYVLVNRISQPLNLLAEHPRTLAADDFSAGVNLPSEIEVLSHRSTDEIGNLAGSFVHMTDVAAVPYEPAGNHCRQGENRKRVTDRARHPDEHGA